VAVSHQTLYAFFFVLSHILDTLQATYRVTERRIILKPSGSAVTEKPTANPNHVPESLANHCTLCVAYLYEARLPDSFGCWGR